MTSIPSLRAKRSNPCLALGDRWIASLRLAMTEGRSGGLTPPARPSASCRRRNGRTAPARRGASGPVARRRSSSASTFLVMACASASGWEPISTHTSSTSSASAWITPSTRWAMLEASAVKKRVSKRRTRPGGVIARAIRNRLDGSGSRPASVNGFQAPSSFTGLSTLRPRQSPVSSQASRIAATASARAREGDDLRTALEQVGLELAGNRSGDGNAVVGLVDAAAGKNIFARHEHHLVVALADQHLRLVAGAVDQDQRRRILGPEIGMVIGFFFFFYGGRGFGHSIPILMLLFVSGLARPAECR